MEGSLKTNTQLFTYQVDTLLAPVCECHSGFLSEHKLLPRSLCPRWAGRWFIFNYGGNSSQCSYKYVGQDSNIGRAIKNLKPCFSF